MHQYMPLAMEVGLSPGDFVLDRDQPPSPQRAEPPIFGPCPLWPNGWIKLPFGTEVGLGLRGIVLDGDPAPPPLKGHSPIFGQRPLWMD